MTRTHRLTSALLAIVLAAVFAISTFVVSFAEGETANHGLIFAQVIEGTAKPETVSGNYAIVPDRAEFPMPVGKDGKAMDAFTLVGNSTKEGSITFTEPGTYQYTAGKLKDDAKAPYSASDFEEGTKTKPLKHVFGYKVERNADGTLNVIPFTCEDPTIVLFTDGTGMTIWNYVKADAPEEPSEKPSEKPTEPSSNSPTEPTSAKPVTNNSNKPVTNSNGTIKTTIVYRNGGTSVVYRDGTNTVVKGGRVNTGDESHLILWVSIIGVAALGLIILFIVRRRKDDDEDSI